MGSPKAASQVLPLPNPRLPPHPIPTHWAWGKGGERCQMLKNKTPGRGPHSTPSTQHGVGGEVTSNLCVSLFSPAVSLTAHRGQI